VEQLPTRADELRFDRHNDSIDLFGGGMIHSDLSRENE
jgi:hypothetical protein